MEMQLLASDPDNAGRSYKALAREAHASVLAVLGIAKAAGPAAAPAVPTGKPPAREAPVPPLSLRGLPNASTANSGGGAEEALGRLKGPAFQDAYSKLTAAQKAALVDD